MVSTSIDENVFVTSGTFSGDTITTTGSQKVVKIEVSAREGIIEYTFVNDINSPDPHVSDPPSEGGTGTPTRKGKDRLRVRETLRVSGWLSDESNTSALSKRNDLEDIFKWGAVITVVWGKNADSEQQNKVGHIVKALIRERPSGAIVATGKAITSSVYQRNFFVDFQVLIEEDR